MSKFNQDVEGRQAVMFLSDCTACPSYSPLNFQSPMGKKGFKGRCMLGKEEERRSGLVQVRKIPCMNMTTVKGVMRREIELLREYTERRKDSK